MSGAARVTCSHRQDSLPAMRSFKEARAERARVVCLSCLARGRSIAMSGAARVSSSHRRDSLPAMRLLTKPGPSEHAWCASPARPWEEH